MTARPETVMLEVEAFVSTVSPEAVSPVVEALPYDESDE
jgi:hypothetical protein